MNVVVLGAGLTGLSAAYHLNKRGMDYELYEAAPKIGGLCASERVKGFTFDRTLHVLLVKNQHIETLVEVLGNKFDKQFHLCQRRALVHFKGTNIPYPFQGYFPMLPFPSVVKDCIMGLQRVERSDGSVEPTNFKDWVDLTFGDGIAEHFMVPYNQKLWTVPLDELVYDWTTRYVPIPKVKDILRFMKNPGEIDREYGYNVEFYYPIQGGIEVLPQSFASQLNQKRLHLSHEMRTIRLSKKELLFTNGETVKWDMLVSTIPLPQLVLSIEDVPSTIREAASNLRYISIYNLNLGIEGRETTGAHWIYFPDKPLIFHRIGVPSNLSPHMAPSGRSSLSIEVSYSKHKPLPKEVDSRILRDLMKTRLIDSKNAVLLKKAFTLPYAYVIYDQNYYAHRQKILAFLERKGIFSVGRYGSWEYSTMGDAILAGRNVAAQVYGVSERSTRKSSI